MGQTGIYFIYLNENEIEYPIANCKLIYIGMSESKENSIGKRLKDHLTGQSGNYGISNYAKFKGASFTSYTLKILQNLGTSNLFDIESLFLENFLSEFGSYPICNGQAGHKLETDRNLISELIVDWSFFCNRST
tara:strand:- start:265 stop:666 length:402 start_codon:yes stop_codon:yes gene_type:complete